MKITATIRSKALLLLLVSVLVVKTSRATDYFLTTANAGNAQTPASWNDGGINGGGSAASDFTTPGDRFIVSVNGTVFRGNSLTIGVGVTLEFQGSATLTIGSGANNSNTTLQINGVIEFSSTSATQVILPTGGNTNTNTRFILSTDATFITPNANGVTGTNCSVSPQSGRAFVTINTGANFTFNGPSQATTGMSATVNNIIISGTLNKTFSASTTINGSLTIEDGATAIMGAFTFQVNGTTTIGNGSSGILNITSTTGSKTFVGLVTINVGGTWNNSGNEATTFRGGITNNGTFNAGTGVHTFDTNNQQVSGSVSIPSITITTVTLTNNGDLTVSTAIAGTGALTNAENAILDYSGSNPIAPTLNATDEGNTVKYSRSGAQTVKPTTYHNLTLSGTGTNAKTTTNVTVNGVLSIEGTATVSAMSYGPSATLQYNTSTAREAGTTEWPAVITNGTLGGGIIIANSGTISLGINRTTLNVPLKINAGSTLALSAFALGSTNGPSSLTLEIGTTAASITGSGTLTLGGNVNIIYLGSGSASASIACPIALVNATSRTFTVADGGNATDLTLSGIVSTSGSIVKAGTGTMTLSGTNSFTGSVTINAGTLNVASVSNGGANSNLGAGTTVVLGGGTLSYTGATANFNKAINLTASTTNTISVTTGGTTLTANGTVTGATGNLIKGGTGTLLFGSQDISVNDLTISAGTLNAGSSNLTIDGTFTNNGTFTAGTSTAIFGGSGQIIPTSGITYNNIRVINTGLKTLAGNMTIAGNIEVTGGTLDVLGFTANRSAPGGSLTVSSGATLKIGTTLSTNTFPSNYNTITLDANSTVHYAGAGQALRNAFYGHLTLSGSGTKTLVSGTTTTVRGALNIDGTTLSYGNVGTSTLVLQGSVTAANNAAITMLPATATLEFNNTAADVSVPSSLFTTLPNLRVSGGKQVSFTEEDKQITISISLQITNNSKLAIGPRNQWNINGTVSMDANNCLVGVRSAVVRFGGTSAKTVFFDQTTDGSTNAVRVLNLANSSVSVTLGNTLRVIEKVAPFSEGGVLNTNGNLVLMSNADSAARIFRGSDTILKVYGNVTIERYIPAKTGRRWLFLSSPVHDTSIRKAWQDDIFIAGPGTGGSPCGDSLGNGTKTQDKYNSNGFDATNGNQQSLFKFNKSQAWELVATTHLDSVKRGRGYRVLYRASRRPDTKTWCDTVLNRATPPAPTAGIINVLGPPTYGVFTDTVYGKTTGARGYTLLGNPYACELDFDNFYSANQGVISQAYWTTDPFSSSTNYVTVFKDGNGAWQVPFSPSGRINSSNAMHIAHSQAFFVESENGGMVTFNEAGMATDNTQRGGFRNANNTSNYIQRKVSIQFDKTDGSFTDKIIVSFTDNPTATLAESRTWDARTLNSGSFVASIKGTGSFAVQTRPLNFFNDTVIVRIVSATTGDFKLSFSDFSDFNEAAEIILLDLFAGTQQDIKQNPEYSFSITSTTTTHASQGRRFRLVFRSQHSVLPLSFLNISATQKQTGVEVAWKLAYEHNVNSYTVERSDNGRDFQPAGTVAARGNSNTPVDYTFHDSKPFNGMVYYRVKSNEASGETKYSAVVKVNGSKENLISVYPNPAKDHLKINIASAASSTKPTVLVRNAQGKTVLQQVVQGSNGNFTLDISSLSSGMYFLTVVTGNGDSLMEKFMKQ